MSSESTYFIRPAGRHILTIGRDLIQDQYAAIVELVKNAYDADASSVWLHFHFSTTRDSIAITVRDDGHGMSRDTVINKWLVPSTDDKVERKFSPGGRVMQGRKGIGRYAASILGNDLLLETVDVNGNRTELYVEWKDFERADFLDQVLILVDTQSVIQASGTVLTMKGGVEHALEWDARQIRKLQYELKKLVPPINNNELDKESDTGFSIYLSLGGSSNTANSDEYIRIEPYPIFDLFDYKIAGAIDSNGSGSLTFINQRARNTPAEVIGVDLGRSTGCGNLVLDLRVYDRERESIDLLIRRGLKDENGNYVGKLEARQLLDQYNGVGVYRNGFRIRPLGDPDFDWLKLNELRIQNPSMKISSNQVIGYVLIQSEEQSGLEEKSARDGLRENYAYEQLKNITHFAITELEQRRFAFRAKTGIGRNVIKVERDLERLFSFDDVKRTVRQRMTTKGVDKQVINEIIDLLGQKEDEKNKIVDDLRRTVAIYQGQATLGKIINVILHEGRRPLNYFKNQGPNLIFWANELEKQFELATLEEVISLTEGMGQNAKTFVQLFGRLDPLAAGKRGKRKEYGLKGVIEGAFRVFENELISSQISYKVDCHKDAVMIGWQEDMYVIITNLIDNSVFWMNEKNSTTKQIDVLVSLSSDAKEVEYIDYRDTGPGIEPQLIESGVIFEPEFTTKVNGTGLGLAIAGEAASRNGLELIALQAEVGAFFRLRPKQENSNETN